MEVKMTNAPLNSVHHRLIDTAVQTAFSHADWQLDRIISEGLSTATLYKITVSDQPYIVRINGHDHTPDQFKREYAAMSLAANRHIAPTVHYANANTGVLLMGFIADQSIYSFNLTDPVRFARLARFIHALHQLPDFLPDAPMTEKVDGLFALCSPAIQANALAQQVITLKSRLAEQLVDEGDKRPSHADINPTNLLYDGQQLWLIDWASATQQSFYFDLACASIWFFYQNEPANAAFLQAYLQREPTEDEHRKFYLMRLFVAVYYGIIFLFLGTLNETPLIAQEEIDALPPYAPFMEMIGSGQENLAQETSRQKMGFVFLKNVAAAQNSDRFARAMGE
jgi:thiamine kinase-like enzyme